MKQSIGRSQQDTLAGSRKNQQIEDRLIEIMQSKQQRKKNKENE